MIEHNPGFKVYHEENILPIYVDTMEQAKIVELCFVAFTLLAKHDHLPKFNSVKDGYFDFQFTSNFELREVICRNGNTEDFESVKDDPSEVILVYSSKIIRDRIEDFLEEIYTDIEKLKDAKNCLFGCAVADNSISIKISEEIGKLDKIMNLLQNFNTYLYK